MQVNLAPLCQTSTPYFWLFFQQIIWFNAPALQKDFGQMRYLTFILAVLTALVACGSAFAASSLPEDKYSAVVLAYHRIGEDAYPDSNLRTDQFVAHIDEIANSDYTVLPLAEILSAVKERRELPKRALAITFEGAYKSTLEKAVPLLLEKNLPFTIFYSSGQIGSGSEEIMGWNELKNISGKQGVSLGVLPAAYTRLSGQSEEEIRRQVNSALVRHREIFAAEPQFFSYPFGEYSLTYKKIIRESGFQAAFALHSGTVYEGSDFFVLPRFTMTERFGDLERFRLVVNALPLPAIDIEPQEPHLGAGLPKIGFSLPPSLEKEIKDISCFISGRDQPELEILGNRIELRLKDIPGDERLRLNCTLPGPMDTDLDVEQWRWLGMLLIGKTLTPAEEEDPNQQPDVPQ